MKTDYIRLGYCLWLTLHMFYMWYFSNKISDFNEDDEQFFMVRGAKNHLLFQ